jgi:hypothetical protein
MESQQSDQSSEMFLQLGDIIQIEAPNNEDLNNKIFYIQYIDTTKIVMIDDNSMENTILNINEDGNLTDESIQLISLLNRNDNPGYAKQNDLIPMTWVDVHFGGDLPVTLTGQITNLEEDMIEIKTYPENEFIYIDFAYKGIPEDLPIESILIREAPEASKNKDVSQEEKVEEPKDVDPNDVVDEPNNQVEISTDDIKNQLKDVLLKANEIEIGDDLDEITQVVEVSEDQKRYSIETQVSDLLDELLSTIPNGERTRSVLNNIHTTIERYKQLRTMFSEFDVNGNAKMPKLKGSNYKPLVENIYNMNFNLSWLLPVATNIKKTYDLEFVSDDKYPDVVNLQLNEECKKMEELQNLYMNNKLTYKSYYSKVNDFFVPHEDVDNENVLFNGEITQNINAVIDNLGDLYSSIVKGDNLRRKRFVITKYNLGNNMLQLTDKSKNKSVRISVENKERISLKSLIFLPEPTVKFSKVMLPNTNILDKSDLNQKYLQYWKFLRKNTTVTQNIIDDVENEYEHDSNFLKHINEYLLDETISSEDKYRKYLETIIPKTRVLFKNISKYLNGNLTLNSVLYYLEPFLVYQDDLTFMQYKEISEFIEQRILMFKQRYAKNKENFSKLLKSSYTTLFYEALFFKLLKGETDVSEIVLNSYNIKRDQVDNDINKQSVYSTSELLTKMNELDNGKLYNTSLSYVNLDLYTPFNFEDLLEEKTEEVNKKIDDYNNDDEECKMDTLTLISKKISKKYVDKDDISKDNNITIYYDKIYDKTMYSYINDFSVERETMGEEEFKIFLSSKLVDGVGLSVEDADVNADAMINGKKEVRDGDYCVLVIDNLKSVKYEYYKRENKIWVRDNSIDETMDLTNSQSFCNVKEKCMSVKDECSTTKTAVELFKQNLLKEMADEFDEKYKENVQEIQKRIQNKYEMELKLVSKLRNINNYRFYKYVYNKLSLFKGVEDADVKVSPYENVRDLVLSQSDFVKKQNDIIKFVNKFCRDPIEENDENPYFFYCMDTQVKLMPTFLHRLASVFVQKGDYFTEVETICKDQGALSDDGGFWVDKHSGYIIKQETLSSEEGYDDSGFKLKSNDVLNVDIADVMNVSSADDNVEKNIENPLGKVIINIVSTITGYMGINLNNRKDDIVSNVLLNMERNIPTKEDYNKKMEYALKAGKKKMSSYDEFVNQSLLYYTFAYTIIYIQTSIPSLTSKKTHPGCVRSFSGYPLEGEEDLTGITYLSCIVSKIKQKTTKPWSSIYKSKENTIRNKTKVFIDSIISQEGNIQELIDKKKIYLLQNEDNLIPLSLDVKYWNTFLPPLQEIKNKTPVNIGETFREDFINNLKKPTKNQHEKVNVVKSKSIYFSLSILQSIDKQVEKESLLLHGNNNTHFLQNACCSNGNNIAIDYFIEKDPSIKQKNDIVNNLRNIILDMHNMTQPSILLDNVNRKLKVIELSPIYNEETIYQGFIEFCNFNVSSPVPQEYNIIVNGKPERYDKTLGLQERIKMLKEQGFQFTPEKFEHLLEIVSKKSILHIKENNTEYSLIQNIRSILSHLKVSSVVLEDEFITLFNQVLDTYEIAQTEDNSKVRNFRNYLGKKTKDYKDYVLEFMNLNVKEREKMELFIDNIVNFDIIGNDDVIDKQDETLYRGINYVKSMLFNFISIIPNFISNNVDYTDIKMCEHWGLSEDHSSILSKMLNNYYVSLDVYKNDDEFIEFLLNTQVLLGDLNILIQQSNFYGSIDTGKNVIHSIIDNRTCMLLFQFYFTSCLYHFCMQINDNTMFKYKKKSNTPMEDIISSVEYDDEIIGNTNMYEVIKGNKLNIKEKISSYLKDIINMFDGEKKTLNYNKEKIISLINRSKDKEREEITTYLRDLSIEEREIENIMKNNRLGKWNLGLQKGLVQYDKNTFDDEIYKLEQKQIAELKANKAGQASNDMFMYDLLNEENIQKQINEEEYDMNDVTNDDDNEDNDDSYIVHNEE